MSCSSALYAGNTAVQTATAGTLTTISFGEPIRRFGRNCDISGGNVVIRENGYYSIDTNFTITSTAAGEITVQLYKDGVAIPSGLSTFSGAADITYSVSVPCIVRNKCCCESTITATITAAGAAIISNAAIEVEKI